MSQERLGETERRVDRLGRRMDDVASQLAELRQLLHKLANGLGQGQGGGSSSLIVGKATTAITARSGTTPGSGTVEAYDATTGTLTATGATFAVKNAGAAISSGKYVMSWIDKFGVRWVEPEECES